MSPFFITILYFNITIGLGQIALLNDIGFVKRYKYIWVNIEHIKEAIFVLIFFNLIISFIFSSNLKKIMFALNTPTQKLSSTNIRFIILSIAFVCLSFVKIDLSLIGGVGNLNFPFPILLSTYIGLTVSKQKFNPITFCGILLIIIIMMVNSFNNKREIIFVIISLFLPKLLAHNPETNYKKIFLTSLLALPFILLIIVVSSIQRGYGSFQINSFWDTFVFIDDYLALGPAFLSALAQNLELTFIAGDYFNAIDLFFRNKSPELYGETFFKGLFIGIPEDVLGVKPRSMIDIYTTMADPTLRTSIGQSYPVTLYPELLWNFSILFIIPLIIIYFFMDKVFMLAILCSKSRALLPLSSLSLVSLILFFSFIRGSGIDLFIIYLIVSLPLSVTLHLLYKRHT